MGKYEEITNEIMNFFGILAKEKPKTTKGFMSMHQSIEEDSALTAKEKEFIALGIGISTRCEGCIAAHVGSLIELGATKEEIIDVISVAVLMGGGPAITYGAVTYNAYEEMSN
jgi:AhpD family alkylhydroperoxidase